MICFFKLQEQPTIVIVPGIANCTETKYVRTFTGYAISQGFRVAVLNHLGAKKEAGLSTPRIFTYGKDVQFNIFLLQQHFVTDQDSRDGSVVHDIVLIPIENASKVSSFTPESDRFKAGKQNFVSNIIII